MAVRGEKVGEIVRSLLERRNRKMDRGTFAVVVRNKRKEMDGGWILLSYVRKRKMQGVGD